MWGLRSVRRPKNFLTCCCGRRLDLRLLQTLQGTSQASASTVIGVNLSTSLTSLCLHPSANPNPPWASLFGVTIFLPLRKFDQTACCPRHSSAYTCCAKSQSPSHSAHPLFFYLSFFVIYQTALRAAVGTMSSGPNYAFSTPQNTPANNAPINSRAQQPGLGSVKEGQPVSSCLPEAALN